MSEYELLEKKAINERRLPDDRIERVEKIAFSLHQDGTIIRVWWDKRPGQKQIDSVIRQVQRAILR